MIHSTSCISEDAKLGAEVEIGPFTVVHGNVVIGAGTRIGSHCTIGEPTSLSQGRPLVLGQNSLIRSHTVLYEGSSFGDGLETGHHVTAREGLDVGVNLRVGSLSDLQGDARIGDFVRLHSSVHVGKLSDIGAFVWIFPYSVLTNDPHPPSDVSNIGVTVEAYAVVATMCCLAPGVRVGTRSLVAASSMVTRDVPPDTVVRGAPAKSVGPATDILLRDGSSRPAYPWTEHFHRGFPLEVVEHWKETK